MLVTPYFRDLWGRKSLGYPDKVQPPPSACQRRTCQRNGGPLPEHLELRQQEPSLPAQTGHISLFPLGYSAWTRRLSPSLTSWMKSSTVWSKLTAWNTTGLKFLCSKDLTNRTVTTTPPAMSRWAPGNNPVDARWIKHNLCVNVEFFSAGEADMDHLSLDQSIAETFSSSCTTEGECYLPPPVG